MECFSREQKQKNVTLSFTEAENGSDEGSDLVPSSRMSLHSLPPHAFPLHFSLSCLLKILCLLFSVSCVVSRF
jgi:hypothetical protein